MMNVVQKRYGCTTDWSRGFISAIRTFFLGMGLCLTTSADTIRLTNGRTLEGIVEKETDTEVVLDLGVGSMTIPRASIAGIEYGDESARARLVEEWRRRYYLHSRYVPPRLQPLVDALRAAESKREAAIRAHQAARREEDVVRQIRDAMAADQKRLMKLGAEMQNFPLGADPGAYNELVRKVNALQVGVVMKQHELEAAEDRRKQKMQAVGEYMRILLSLENSFREARQNEQSEGGDGAVRYLLDKIAERLKELQRDVRETEQPVREAGGTTIVTALINGTERGEFILDTGAGLVSISETFARAVGLDVARAPETELVMADGRHVRGKAVLLRSVQVGDAVVYQVPAVVMPMGLRGNVDGLLGMSFLQHFAVHLDVASGRVTLRQFNPR